LQFFRDCQFAHADSTPATILSWHDVGPVPSCLTATTAACSEFQALRSRRFMSGDQVGCRIE
jgi:hypothetical protein